MDERRRIDERRISFRTIERAVVAAIFVILAGLVVPTMRSWSFHREEKRASADLVRIRDALRRFMADVGTGPTRNREGKDGELYRLLGPGLIPEGAYFYPDDHQGFLENHLIRNAPCGADQPGYARWRGPYLDTIDPDPWGFAYAVIAYPLNRDDDRDCIVVSCGRNGIMDGGYASARDPVAVGDDLIEVVLDKSPEHAAPVH